MAFSISKDSEQYFDQLCVADNPVLSKWRFWDRRGIQFASL